MINSKVEANHDSQWRDEKVRIDWCYIYKRG